MKRKLKLLIIGMILLLTACRGQEVDREPKKLKEEEDFQPKEGEKEYYRVYLDGEMDQGLVLDSQGNLVDEEDIFYPIFDLVDGSLQCYYKKRLVASQEEDVFGPVIGRVQAGLYGPNKEKLLDFSETSFSPGFGDYIIRDLKELYDFKKDQVLIEDLGYLSPIDGEHFLATNEFMEPRGIINKNLDKISGFPFPEELISSGQIWQGHIILNRKLEIDGQEKYEDVVYNLDLEPLFSSYILVGDGQIPLLKYFKEKQGDRQESGLIDIDGNIVYKTLLNMSQEVYEQIQYFNDELLIFHTNLGGKTNRYDLLDYRTGELILEGYNFLRPWDYLEDRGIYLGQKNGQLQLIDRRGQVLKSLKIEDLAWINIYGDYLVVEPKSPGLGASLLSKDLEVLVPFGSYKSISNYRSEIFSPDKMVFMASYESENQALELTDILDEKGQVLIEGLNKVYDLGPDRLVVKKGFYFGLMDYRGQWIKKHSIFR